MKIILASLFIIRPGRTSEDASPIGRLIRPDVPVALIIVPALTGFLEPGVFTGGMVKDKVHHNPDVSFFGLDNQFFHVFHGSVCRVYVVIVCNIIAVVCLRRDIARSKPDGTDSQVFQIIKF